jgi:hypothetical protein
VTALICRVWRRVRTVPPATWACDKCGAINSDNTVTCWKCGS